MSINKEYGKFELTCDICFYVIGFDSFDDARVGKYKYDWISRKNENDEWEDVCPACQLLEGK